MHFHLLGNDIQDIVVLKKGKNDPNFKGRLMYE